MVPSSGAVMAVLVAARGVPIDIEGTVSVTMFVKDPVTVGEDTPLGADTVGVIVVVVATGEPVDTDGEPVDAVTLVQIELEQPDIPPDESYLARNKSPNVGSP